ncbi:MAG: hypothetical protein QY302_00745 [Anaerolineales bacterium]|nr:MAG: hypothetical protein QY302_00745 [Anaerolineales bacterium]
MKSRVKNLPGGLLVSILLTVIAALVYLPFVFQFGYYFDDWYIMFAAGARGAEAIREIYSIDRPAGAFLMNLLYGFFGANPFLYNLSGFAFRVAGAVGVFALCATVWTQRRAFAFTTALLFLIYPGFLSQPNGITYQYYLAGLAAATWSIALTARSILSDKLSAKAWYFSLSIVLGWFYLSQIEWYIGFEAIRWAIILMIHFREGGNARQNVIRAVLRGSPAFLIPIVFLGWRLFFFESERGATDVGLQLGGFFSYPLQMLFRWATSLAQDMFNVLFSAWTIPLERFAFPMDASNQAIGLCVGALCILLAWFGLKQTQDNETTVSSDDSTWRREMFWLGLIALIAGLLPVTLANREVAFPTYSRYTLAASLGAAVLFALGLVSWFTPKSRRMALSILILTSALTHYGNGLQYATTTQRTRDFWHQVAWRVPQFQKNTTLIANIASVATEEDYFVWGPANFIYYPQSQNAEAVQPALYAAVLNQNTIQNVLLRERQEYDNRRGVITYKNYRNILILSQPSPNSCVHVINGLQPEFSSAESDSIRVIGSYSEIEHILVDETHHTPPELVFGPEPTRTWCFFFQSADLARQRGEWETVIHLGEEAKQRGLSPADLIEWMPFIQAYAITGDVERLSALAPVITAEPYIALQVCRILGGVEGLSSDVIETVDSLYCLE